MPGPASNRTHHAREIGIALDNGGRVGGDLLDIRSRLFVSYNLHVRAFLGERVAQALPGSDEVACGKIGDRADLARRQVGFLVVAALILAMLIAEIVPVRADIGEALRRREIAVCYDRRHFLVDAFVDFRCQRVVPTADDNHAGRILGAFGIDSCDECREVDRCRTGDAHLYIECLAGRFKARIDALDEERQIGCVADPDIFLVCRLASPMGTPSPVGSPACAALDQRQTGREYRRLEKCVRHDVLSCLPSQYVPFKCGLCCVPAGRDRR